MLACLRRVKCGPFVHPIRRQMFQTRFMADLYFTPTSCGAASFISAYKAGILGEKLNAYKVDIKSHKVLTGPNKGKDFYMINPKGNVPALVLDDKTLINENSATLQWIADQNRESGLAPPNGTSARYLLQSNLSFLSSEVHAAIGLLFNPSLSPSIKEFLVQRAKSRLEYLNKVVLSNRTSMFLVGDGFTVADAYLYVILTWMKFLEIDLDQFPLLKQYLESVSKLDFIREAHSAMNEGK